MGLASPPPGNAVICLSHSRERGEEVEKGAAALRESLAPLRALYPSSLVTVRRGETLNVSRKGAGVLTSAPFAGSASIDLFVRCDEKRTKKMLLKVAEPQFIIQSVNPFLLKHLQFLVIQDSW